MRGERKRLKRRLSRGRREEEAGEEGEWREEEAGEENERREEEAGEED
jgi:hypothetical protein